MKKYLKIIIIPILILIAVVLGIFLKPKNKQVEIKSHPLPTPNIPEFIKQKPQIESLLIEKDFSFPNNLPILIQNKPSLLTDDLIRGIADNFGFNTEPIKAKDTRYGTIYIWSLDNSSLIINPVLRKVSYSAFSTYQLDLNDVINKQLSDDDFVQIAKEFLTNKTSKTEDDFEFSGFIYLKKEIGTEGLKQTTKEDSQIIQANFSPSNSGLPIVTLNPLENIYCVYILKDSSILGAEIILPGSISTSDKTYRVKNFDEFNKTKDQSIIVSLNDNNINLSDISTDSIQKITIDKISLAYYLDNKNYNELQPVFLLYGKASLKNYKNEINIVLYLPALTQSP